MIRNMIRFYGEELLAPRPTTKLEDHPLSAFRDCLFYILAATLHIGGRSSMGNLWTRHAVVQGLTNHGLLQYKFIICNMFEHGERTTINNAVQAHTLTHVICVH
jgi:hypothetical protein